MVSKSLLYDIAKHLIFMTSEIRNSRLTSQELASNNRVA